MLFLGVLASGTWNLVTAQCPDGTPPPCARPAARPPRVAVPAAAERARRFLVLPFRNITRAAEHEWMVEGSTTMLNDALSRWQEIRVVPDDRLYPALRSAGIAPGSVAAPEAVRRLSQATGGWTAVTGEFLATGGRVRVTARAVDVVTRRELARATSVVSEGADVRAAYDTIGAVMLRSAGLDAAAAPDLTTTTTRSLDAYRAYLRGMAHANRSEVRRAQTAFQEAVRLDSAFALAWARLAEATFAVSPENFFDPAGAAVTQLARAHARSTQLPPKERRVIQSLDALMRGRIGEARATLQAALDEDSLDVEAMSQLSGVTAMDPILVPGPGGGRPRGSWNTALTLAKRVIELDPARHREYNTLVSLYLGAAGWPPGIVVGRARELGSFAEMVRAQPDRLFIPLFRDSIVLVPLESLPAVPRDTIQAARRRARDAARGWAQRWVAVAPGEAASWHAVAKVRELDGDFGAALAALVRAESLGVEEGFEPAPVRRMILSAKAGRLADAVRVNDSLWAARWFDSTNVVLANRTEGANWSFALNLMTGHADRDAAMLERLTRQLAGLGLPDAVAEGRAFEVLVGNPYAWLDPPIAPEHLAAVADTVLAHPLRLARSGALSWWMPLLLNRIAGALDSSGRYAPRLVAAAFVLADSGLAELAWQVASNAVILDSAVAPRLADAPWYRTRSEDLERVRRDVQRRFAAATARVTDQELVVEWRVDGDSALSWFRAVVPPGRGEYRWQVEVAQPGHIDVAVVALAPRLPGNAPRRTPLAAILNASQRAVLVGPDSAHLAPRPGTTVRTELVAGGFRMIVRDSVWAARLLAARPREARFRFFPCYHDPAPPHREECVDQRVPIVYP